MSRFIRDVNFASLGLRDLIEARDLYHANLANMPNVIGTALGRYLTTMTLPLCRRLKRIYGRDAAEQE